MCMILLKLAKPFTANLLSSPTFSPKAHEKKIAKLKSIISAANHKKCFSKFFVLVSELSNEPLKNGIAKANPAIIKPMLRI